MPADRSADALTRQRVVACLGVAMLLAVAALGACGSSDDGALTTPGYDGSPTTLDTQPFALSESNSKGSTTLPDGFFDPNGTTNSSITTTTALGELVQPNLGQITTLCGFESVIGPYELIGTRDPPEVEALMNTLVDAAVRYGQVSPAVVRGDFVLLVERFRELRDLLGTVGWDARSPTFSAEVDRIRGQALASEPDSLGVLLTTIVEYEHATCS